MPAAAGDDRKGHVCPPSDAVHPSGRWESLFVYSFICKFTNLRAKVEGLETPMDLEEALMSQEPNDILTRILAQFVLNLKPQTRNLSTDQISTTVASVLSDYFKSSERTVFWNDELGRNVDPFVGLEGGFFTADWDFKLKILRQLVELQLSHNVEMKGIVDRAWGVSQHKHKKKDASTAPPDPSDPNSQECLQVTPIGQDSRRTRYWVIDDSPRVFTSTNPWKITATFQAVSSTKEEYLAVIEELKATAPRELKKGEKRTRLEQSHLTLLSTLEGRIEAIDNDLARVAKVRKKLEQRKRNLMVPTIIRETRTRRQAQKPDYVYADHYDSEQDDGGEYQYREDDGQDAEFQEEDYLNFRDAPGRSKRRPVQAAANDLRRSARAIAKVNANGKRESSTDSWSGWRGERRSARLGGIDAQYDLDPPPKRARTEESTASSNSMDNPPVTGVNESLKIKSSGAAALKPNEIALEAIAGKKRSKFWVYAVEPLPEHPTNPDPDAMNEDSPTAEANGHGHHNHIYDSDHTTSASMTYHRSLEDSLSPLHG